MIPESVRVGPVTYQVRTDEASFTSAVVERGGGEFYGLSHHRRALIVLNPTMAEDVRRLTLWHEVMHCLLEVMAGAPDWSEPSLGADKDAREETAIRTFEYPTLQVLRDNPTLAAYLLE